MSNIYIVFFMVLIFCSGCSLSRSLPEGGHVYIGSKVKIIKPNKKTNTKQLETTYNTLIKQPKPNKKFLGMRLKLRRYNLFAKTNKKRVLKGSKNLIGKPPVIYDEQITTEMKKVMKNKAFNEGFFNVVVSSEVKKRKHKASVKYTVEVKSPFIVNRLTNGVEDSLIRTHINHIQNASLLKTGQLYSLQKLKSERERISTTLRQKGFYFFREDYLKFQADTLNTGNKVQLNLILKELVDSSHLKPKTIDKIYVFPDFKAKLSGSLEEDTLDYEGLKIISQKTLIRPSVFRKAISLKQGQRYSLTTHQSTLEHLSYLRNHQFIDIKFEQSEVSDTLINAYVKLSPRKRDAIEGSIGFSLNSGLYLGPEVSLTYLNRNLFKGAEQLRVTTFGNFNFPIAEGLASQRETGLKIELSKPGLIVPFRKKINSEKLIAKSKVEFIYSSEKIRIPLTGTEDYLFEEGYIDLFQRLNADSTFAPFISLDNLELNLAYQWRTRPDLQHELTPISLIYQNPRYEFSELRKLLLDIIQFDDNSEDLQLNLEKMLILKPSYVFLYDSRLKKLNPHNYYYRGKIAIAGNRLLSKDLLPTDKSLESQFFQLENDIRYFRRFSPRQTIGARFAVKVSVPFKNEVILPFFDLYTIGGSNSVRAFRPRSVGPGSVEPADEIFFFTGTGDFLLESSLEWRPKINDLLELGFFVDAGNVWLFKGGEGQDELTTFKFNNFYKQLAIGAGIGLRFDFDIIILRLDFATPLTKPWLPEGARWVGDKIALGSFPWVRKNLTLNLGFGYSF